MLKLLRSLMMNLVKIIQVKMTSEFPLFVWLAVKLLLMIHLQIIMSRKVLFLQLWLVIVKGLHYYNYKYLL